MFEKTAKSWTHLQELLYEESWNQQLDRFRSPSAFRGLSDSGYMLETSFMRLRQRNDQLERHLLRNFKKYAHDNAVAHDSLWHWLSIAQHHGLPTRLMDWSYSPFVAMHFATSRLEDFDRDGAIWVINYEQAHQSLPSTLREALHVEGANIFTAEILSSITNNLEEFDGFSDLPFLLFFEPPSMNQRIVNQYAILSTLSNPKLVVDVWARKHEKLCRKIIIPAKIKWEVRDKLDQANITERVLFPGMDGLTSWLKRHYSQKEPT